LLLFLAEELELEQLTDPDTVPLEQSYRGPHIHLPIDKGHLEALIHAFQRGEVRELNDVRLVS
jgi:hypothetical protein